MRQGETDFSCGGFSKTGAVTNIAAPPSRRSEGPGRTAMAPGGWSHPDAGPRQPASVAPAPSCNNGANNLWQSASSIMAQQQHSLPLKRLEPRQLSPLSFAQERLWQLQQSEPASPYYHVTLAWDISGILNVAALERSLDFLVRRHEVLRACFPDSASGPKQKIEDWHLKLAQADLSAVEGPAQKRREQTFNLA